MWRTWSPLEIAAAIAVGGSVVAVAVPAFLTNLSASKLTEPIDGLDRIVTGAMGYAQTKPQEISFPPSAPLTPAQVPRAVRSMDPPDAWEHLTWKSLGFAFTEAHAFSFQFDSAFDPQAGTMRFTAAAHGDLDGDGLLSTFEVQGERRPGEPPRVLPGMYVDREVE
jgi:hypothetical protein